MFTTVSRVREVSGIDDSTNVTDDTVRGKIHTAMGEVRAAVGQRYSLPIPYHYDNYITFGGTGTGSDNMTINIGGTNYTFAVTSGMTASEAADAFRRAVKDSTLFITDGEGAGAIVLLISKTDSTDDDTAYGEVLVVDPSDVEGISASGGTRTRRYPRLIEQITVDLAAADLLMDNYGVEAEDTSKDGGKRRTIADKRLQRIAGTDEDGIISKVYDEVTGAELALSSQEEPLFAPNDTTGDEEYEDQYGEAATSKHQTSMNMEF